MGSLIAQPFRVFAYDPSLDDGAYRPIGDTWAGNETEALLQYKAANPQLFVLDGRSIQLIARAHSEKHRWPDAQTGRLPKVDNQTMRDDFRKGRI